MPTPEQIEFEVACGTDRATAEQILKHEESLVDPMHCDCGAKLIYNHGIGGFKCRNGCGALYTASGKRIG
jgi:hypothetical protein